MAEDFIEIAGLKIDKRTNIVMNGTIPVKERYYHSSKLHPSIKCYDNHTGLYQNVELFSPVIYDLDNPMPKYNPLWEVYDNPNNKKLKKLVRINYPQYYLKWWYEQRKRCIEGYTVGGVFIQPEHYFYLNFWRIKTKKRGGGMIPPNFIDLDKEFFDLVARARREDKNLMILKRRQIGFTEKLSSMCAAEALLYPSSQTLIVAGLESYAENAFFKVKLGMDALSPYSQEQAGREFYKRRIKDVPDYLQLGFKVGGEVSKGYLSEIYSITTKDNAQAANGKSPTLVFMEEAGINPLLRRVYNMILPAVQEQGKQDGRIVIIVGTGGEMKKGVADMMSMFYDPNKYNLLSVPNTYEENMPEGSICCPFFPAHYYHIIDNDGNSYKEAGIEDVKAQRKKKKGDKKELHEHKVNFPLDPKEAFSVSGLAPWNTQKLEDQRTNLLVSKWEEQVQWGRFDEIIEDGEFVGVKWTPAPMNNTEALDAEGDFLYPVLMIEHPDRPNEEDENHFEFRFGMDTYPGLYSAGTDSYDKDEAATSDSQGSMVIFKGYRSAGSTSMMPACRLTWRPVKKEKFYRQTAYGCMYFGNCENLIEWSNIAIFDWYKTNGFDELLKERPEISYATVKESKVTNNYGVDPNTKSVWIEHFAAYIEDYAGNICDLEGVNRLMNFRNRSDYNCDITISYLLAYEGILDDLKKGINSEHVQTETQSSPFVYGYVKRNGVIRSL